MKKLVLIGQIAGSEVLTSVGKLPWRHFFRYLNTMAVFIVLGLLFSREYNQAQKNPITVPISQKSYYQFHNLDKAFGPIEVDNIHQFTKAEFRSLILSSVPGKLKYRLGRYLKTTLDLCEKYQVDPFWAISIMWTESHFNLKAQSHVQASGLMQIMPATGKFLTKLIEKSSGEEFVYTTIYEPEVNIEMGVFYLKRLLKMFNGNYRLATVAYNMGPGGVFKRLRHKKPVGVRNHYLNKVRKNYANVTRSFKVATAKLSKKHLETFVVRTPSQKYLYTQYNLVDEVFSFVERSDLAMQIAYNSSSQIKKSL